jgi:hypothetical protein
MRLNKRKLLANTLFRTVRLQTPHTIVVVLQQVMKKVRGKYVFSNIHKNISFSIFSFIIYNTVRYALERF